MDLERLFQQLYLQNQRHDSQQALCAALQEEGCLASTRVIEAFSAVDRQHFLEEGCEDAYTNAPVRLGDLHQSAPSVYGNALEALELSRPDLSFLNVGSGTGYFSALIAQLIGPCALHVGLERKECLVRHAREKCASLGLCNIQFTCGNCYLIDVDSSIKFDRIYVGAGAHRDARFLWKLLKPGGIIVGPFQDEGSDSQTLLKAKRMEGNRFSVSPQTAVSYAWLVRPDEQAETPEMPGSQTDIILGMDSPRSRKIILKGPEWGRSSSSLFPWTFRRTVIFLHWASHRVHGSLLGRLPWECWCRHILPWLAFDAFEPRLPEPQDDFGFACATCGNPRACLACSRCRTVRYCNRGCQQRHWPSHKSECKKLAKGAAADKQAEQ